MVSGQCLYSTPYTPTGSLSGQWSVFILYSIQANRSVVSVHALLLTDQQVSGQCPCSTPYRPTGQWSVSMLYSLQTNRSVISVYTLLLTGQQFSVPTRQCPMLTAPILRPLSRPHKAMSDIDGPNHYVASPFPPPSDNQCPSTRSWRMTTEPSITSPWTSWPSTDSSIGKTSTSTQPCGQAGKK